MPDEQYFTRRPTSEGGALTLTLTLRGREYTFVTEAGVFSRARIDPGTKLLLQHLPVPSGARVLDLGCGYGAVGVVAGTLAPEGRVTLVDINERAVELARTNLVANEVANAEVLQSDGFEAIAEQEFDVIALNPPIRAGLAVVHRLIEESAHHLAPGGTFYLVGRTQQGAVRLAKKMAEVVGPVEELAKGGGYRVYVARRA